MSLTKDYQQKCYSTSVNYPRGVDSDHTKARERDKRTKYYLLVFLGFFVVVKFKGYDYLIARQRGCLSVN